MAVQPTTAAEQREQREREHDKAKPQLVVVDLGRRQTPKQIKRLRKGRGKLVGRIDEIVDELTASGTIKGNAQPVVIIVRERTPLPWPFDVARDDVVDDDE